MFEHGASVEHGAPLHFATRHQRSNDIIEFFIHKGASINDLLFQNDKTSWNHYAEALPLGTPLHEAARNKDERIVKLLLQHGADPNIKDNFGQLPEITDTSKLYRHI
jgi:ankyrin repeat protein